MRKIDKEMPYANKKLLQLVDSKANGRVQRFAELIGMSQQRINRLFVKDTRNNQYPRMTDEIKQAVIKRFDLTEEFFIAPRKEDTPMTQTQVNDAGIPLIPTSAMAGSLSGDSVTIYKQDIEEYYRIPSFKNSDFCIRVEGDSMEPKYYRGDIIACKNVPLTDIWFQWGKVYVVDTRQGVLVKHVEKGSDNDHITLVSDNPNYQPFEIPTSELFGVAIVNGLVRVE